jgi:hypothetical protein
MKYQGLDSLTKVKEMVGKCVEHFHLEGESDCIHVEKERMGEAIAEKSEMMELDDLMFADVVDSATVTSQDEWERYQQLPSCDRWKDPLQWWRGKECELPTQKFVTTKATHTQANTEIVIKREENGTHVMDTITWHIVANILKKSVSVHTSSLPRNRFCNLLCKFFLVNNHHTSFNTRHS